MKTLPNSEILPETLFRKLFIAVKESNFSTGHYFDIYIHLGRLFEHPKRAGLRRNGPMAEKEILK
jgi:hypothetical protein